MDFGLELPVASTPPAGGAQPYANPAPPAGEGQDFAAHLEAEPNASAADEAVETPDDGAPEAAEEAAAAAPALPQVLVQLMLGEIQPKTAPSTEPVAGEVASAVPAAPAPNALAEEPALGPHQDASLSAPTAPLPTEPAAAADAAPVQDSASATAGAAAAAETPTPEAPTANTAPLAVPVAGAKLAAKSSSPAKSSNDAAAPVTPVAETGETNADAAIEPAPSDAAPPEPRANAPQTDARNARTEATFTLSGEAAAPSASQTSAAPPSVTPSLATSVSGGAPISQARTPETAPAATQVAQEIVRRFDGDTTHFEVRLDPPELGRVEVRLEVSRDNKVSATVVADSPQTLVELARHARDLQNSLQAAGLDLADHGLSFDLRDSGREARDARSEASRTFEPGSAGSAEDASPRLRAGGLDPWRGRTLDMTA